MSPKEVSITSCERPLFRHWESGVILETPGPGYYTRHFAVTTFSDSPEQADEIFDEVLAIFDHSGDLGIGPVLPPEGEAAALVMDHFEEEPC